MSIHFKRWGMDWHITPGSGSDAGVSTKIPSNFHFLGVNHLEMEHPMTSMVDADGLDVIEALVADATAVEGVANVHEGSSYFAERVIRRAVEQGTLIVIGPKNHPAHIAALQEVPAASEVGVRELVDAVGETLDKDFGFWSSPTQSERRSRLYNAWKAVSKALGEK